MHFQDYRVLSRRVGPIRGNAGKVVRWAVIVALAALGSGCEPILSGVSGAYRGPLPSTSALVDEVVVVRRVEASADGRFQSHILDRMRYYEGGSVHDVNRIIRGHAHDIRPVVDPLQLEVGDRLLVSTTFIQRDELSGSLGIPDWPGHGYAEYPIGSHRITSIERVAP